MTTRKLPPLLVGGVYRCPLLVGVDFSGPDLEREIHGEATALLKLKFANETGLEIPARAFQLQMLMGSLMRLFPQQALAQIRFSLEEDQAEPDPAKTSRG